VAKVEYPYDKEVRVSQRTKSNLWTIVSKMPGPHFVQ
jgi:hypothetical protein